MEWWGPHLYFTKDLAKISKNTGFEVNPYNPCVANIMVNAAQSLCAGMLMT